MQTETYLHPWRLRLAKQVIDAGGLIAYPTEAVYGLGCHPLDGDAVARLLALKHRSVKKGLILIADRIDRLQPYLGKLPAAAMEPVLKSWPGPATWLVPAASGVPGWLTGNRATLAVRVTDHPIAAALCRAVGSPLVSTSANISRHPPARTPLEVRIRCGRGVDLIIHGETGGLARPTPIRNALNGSLHRA
ncbi:MAG: threonylcarbamoyl-AMP synthase [Candidatus Thiodiazotropha sp. (ex Dulcina madagascariensis)]|nr:threonylcarbamoyl-AMP synthase [Candidatus Thiodiazotropha sp. (ex Dulcina madagascariensis)]